MTSIMPLPCHDVCVKVQSPLIKKSHMSSQQKQVSDFAWFKQSGRSPKVVALLSATNFSSNIIELLQLHDAIQIKWYYA